MKVLKKGGEDVGPVMYIPSARGRREVSFLCELHDDSNVSGTAELIRQTGVPEMKSLALQCPVVYDAIGEHVHTTCDGAQSHDRRCSR